MSTRTTNPSDSLIHPGIYGQSITKRNLIRIAADCTAKWLCINIEAPGIPDGERSLELEIRRDRAEAIVRGEFAQGDAWAQYGCNPGFIVVDRHHLTHIQRPRLDQQCIANNPTLPNLQATNVELGYGVLQAICRAYLERVPSEDNRIGFDLLPVVRSAWEESAPNATMMIGESVDELMVDDLKLMGLIDRVWDMAVNRSNGKEHPIEAKVHIEGGREVSLYFSIWDCKHNHLIMNGGIIPNGDGTWGMHT